MAGSEPVKYWEDEIMRGQYEAAAKYLALENERLTALLAERDAEIARLREALEEYADRGNWWQARHVSGDPLDSFGDLPRMVWSWDDMREPWTMARAALAAARGGEDTTA